MKTYLVSEEVLRQVLDAINTEADIYIDNDPEDGLLEYMVELILLFCTILAQPPDEPVAWLHEEETSWWVTEDSTYDEGEVPLYRKDK